jgi:hypothetical protein
MRLLITFCVGIAATLAWQSYGDTARRIIADAYPQLSWLAPETAVAQTAAERIAPTAVDRAQQEQLKEMSLAVVAVRERVDELVAQFAAGQQQTTLDFTAKLQATERDLLDKISLLAAQPAAAPVRRPAPPQAQVR